MEYGDKQSSTIPLINPSSKPKGTASTFQTIGNIVVSLMGTGILALPFGFRIAGWLLGSVGTLIIAVTTCYCMLLLVQCKRKIESEDEIRETKTLGDLGFKSMGQTGRYLTELLLFLSQCGGSVAYLVFIGKNLSSVFVAQEISVNSFIFLLVPVEIALSWINSLSSLAVFSIFADICNVLAMGLVIKEDIYQVIGGGVSFSDRTAITSNLGALPLAGGLAVFCFGGFGVTLSIESSMSERRMFPKLLSRTITCVSLVYVLFSFSGYMAYGEETKDIIMLNLPDNWSSVAVKIGLSLGLIFTFPIMLHPINEIIEGNLRTNMCLGKDYDHNGSSKVTKIGKFMILVSRALVVIGLALLASFVPEFGLFAALIGSTINSILSFVLPTSFHLKILGSSLSFWQKGLDVFVLSCGLAFAAYGTYNNMYGAA